ncbi:hypothetical protein FHS16_005142 [Paenibacillus endophyticus]|uniref:DUF2357 domain-containing protein n=1 Tax=Paenibacillus endophyticus TaxID=1294268 RepID=A0A7W5GCP0_9BACL|nr:hypothetical protein [Paenibacillus endophyticus]MBB3155035.1 hypothetical protein [Paenibacillus endophyticus]
MAMPTESNQRFLIYLLHGEGASFERIPLNNYSLSREPSAPLRITENYQLIVELNTCEEETGVILIWDQLFERDETYTEQPIALSVECNRHVLARGKEEYPWRCGLYQYRIIFMGTTYYGTFEVVPRNFTGRQLETIHDTLNHTLEGLVEDALITKRAVSELEGLEQFASWRYLNWYRGAEHELLQAIKAIELNYDSELKITHTVEATERRQTLKSVRWSAAGNGMRYEGTKSLNRRMELHSDSEPNRLIKHWLRSILETLDRALAYLQHDYEELAQQYDRMENGIEYDENKHQAMSQLKTVAKSYLDQSYNSIYGRKQSLIKTRRQLLALQDFERKCRCDQSLLRKTLYSSFWKSVSDQVPRRMAIGRHHAYDIVFRVWKGSALWQGAGHGRSEERLVPIVKPTALLYEYYVLFTTIECLRRLGYEPLDDTIAEQLRRNFHLSGLQEGTKITLRKEKRIIELTYDGLIDNHEQASLEKQTGFFSTDLNRRPDIRMDLYEAGSLEKKQYMSSFILEVKYRPIRNIYSDIGCTETMLQMSKYFMIRHVHSQNGILTYSRTPVHNVVCVYPGHESSEPVMETGCGSFLQLFPEDNGSAVGMDLLMYMLNQWTGRRG